MYKQVYISNLNALGSSIGDGCSCGSSMAKALECIHEARKDANQEFAIVPWTDTKHAPALAIYEELLVYQGNEQKSTVICTSKPSSVMGNVDIALNIPVKDFPASCKYLICPDVSGYDIYGRIFLGGVPLLLEVKSIVADEDNEHIVVYPVNGLKLSDDDEPLCPNIKDKNLIMLSEKPFVLDKTCVAYVIMEDSLSMKDIKKGDVFCLSEYTVGEETEFRLIKYISIAEKINAILSNPDKKLPAINNPDIRNDGQPKMCDVIIVSSYGKTEHSYNNAVQYFTADADNVFLFFLEETTVSVPIPIVEGQDLSKTKEEIVIPAGSLVYRYNIVPKDGEMYLNSGYGYEIVDFDYFFR